MKVNYETFKEWFLKLEGIDHFLASTVAIVLLLVAHVYNWQAYFLPILDYIAGIGTFYIGWREGKEADENGK